MDATCGRKYDKITGGKAIERRVTRKSRFIAIRVAAIRHVSAKNLFCDGVPVERDKTQPMCRIVTRLMDRFMVTSHLVYAPFQLPAFRAL